MPHLIKLARNHLFDSGFNYNGKLITNKILYQLLHAQSTDLKLAHKITQFHLDVTGSARQRVKLAAQIFSNSTAKAIEYLGRKGLMQNQDWLETSYVFKTFNDWFDVFNSRHKYGSHPGTNAYGTNLENADEIIEKMTDIVSVIRVENHKVLLPFQQGILVNNRSLISLYKDLNERFGISYIMTYRLNQDVLEHFFSYVRAMGATNDNPSALQLRHRLRSYIVGRDSVTIFTINTNNEQVDRNECLTALSSSNYSNEAVEDDYIISKDLLHSIVSEESHDVNEWFVEFWEHLNLYLIWYYFLVIIRHLMLMWNWI